jgi:hypothetical protein
MKQLFIFLLVSIVLISCSKKEEAANKELVTSKALTQQDLDKCVQERISAFRKENGEEAPVRSDVLDEWTDECKAGK